MDRDVTPGPDHGVESPKLVAGPTVYRDAPPNPSEPNFGRIPNEPICIALCVDERYLRQAKVVIGSVLRSNRSSVFHFHVAGFGLDVQATKACLASLFGQGRRHALSVHSLDDADVADLPTTPQFSLNAYARIIVDRFIGAEHSRVLYLDADIVVLGDLRRLWGANLRGATLAAAPDHFRLNPEEIGFGPGDPYFNSGVLLIDMARWRKRDCARRVLDYLVEHGERLPWMDQDALNVVLRDEVHFVGIEWNFQPRCADAPPDFLGLDPATYRSVRDRPSIIHYTTSHKPWNEAFRVHYSGVFLDAARSVGLEFNPRAPIRAADLVLQAKTKLRWFFPGPFRLLRSALRPKAALQMYRAGPGA